MPQHPWVPALFGLFCIKTSNFRFLLQVGGSSENPPVNGEESAVVFKDMNIFGQSTKKRTKFTIAFPPWQLIGAVSTVFKKAGSTVYFSVLLVIRD